MKRLAIAGAGVTVTLALAGCVTDQNPGSTPAKQAGGTDVKTRPSAPVSRQPTAASVAPPLQGKQRVRLWHCGVRLVGYPRGTWEMKHPPFDETNAPASFTGTGTARVVDGRGAHDNFDRLVYLDNGGQRLVFVPGDLVPPVHCA